LLDKKDERSGRNWQKRQEEEENTQQGNVARCTNPKTPPPERDVLAAGTLSLIPVHEHFFALSFLKRERMGLT
jgi:hypothetical protein